MKPYRRKFIKGQTRHNIEFISYCEDGHLYCLCKLCNREFKLNRGSFGLYKSCGCNRTLRGKNNDGFKGYEEISSKFFTHIKRRAISKKLEFNITLEYIWDLFIKQERKCKLSGLSITLPKTGSDAYVASLDRIDSSKGYIIGNVQWVHKDINRMKSNFDEEYFVNLCKLVGAT